MNKKNILAAFVLFLTIFCINTMSCKDKSTTYTIYTGTSTKEKYEELFKKAPPSIENYSSWAINKPLFNALKTELTGVNAMMRTQTEMEIYLVDKGDFGPKEAKKAIKFLLTQPDDPALIHKCLAYIDSSNIIHYLFK